MQLLCVAVLLLSAVTAQPDLWHDEASPSAGESRLDEDFKRGDEEQVVTGAPEQSDQQSPIEGTDGNDQPGTPSQVPPRGKRQAPGGPGGRPSGRRRGPSSGKRPNRRDPEAMVFTPMFKVNNVSFQNVTDVTLKEGENLFLMPRHGGRGPHHQRGGRHGPPKSGQYVKLIYNVAEPNKVSVEAGVWKPMSPGEFFGEEDHPEEDYFQL